MATSNFNGSSTADATASKLERGGSHPLLRALRWLVLLAVGVLVTATFTYANKAWSVVGDAAYPAPRSLFTFISSATRCGSTSGVSAA